MQQQLDREVMMQDWMAAFRFLRDHEATTGRLGAVGFCYGGGVVNELAVRMPDLGAGVPFYGSPPALEGVPEIRAPLMVNLAGLDDRVNSGYPDYVEALLEYDKDFTVHVYKVSTTASTTTRRRATTKERPHWLRIEPSNSSIGS